MQELRLTRKRSSIEVSSFPLLLGLQMPTIRRPVADNKQSTATTLVAKHRNRRVLVPGGQEARDSLNTAAPAAADGRQGRTGIVLDLGRSHSGQSSCHGYIAINNSPQLLGHHGYPFASPPSHGHCCYSATAPWRRSANGCRRRDDTLLAAAADEHSSKQQSTQGHPVNPTWPWY
jgi:hypothetical protein